MIKTKVKIKHKALKEEIVDNLIYGPTPKCLFCDKKMKRDEITSTLYKINGIERGICKFCKKRLRPTRSITRTVRRFKFK